MKEYKVKNVSQMDVNLGEIKVRIPKGKTVDLLKEVHVTPYIIEREKDEARSLGKRLKQKILVEVVEGAENLKVIDRPTVFQAKSDEINFPNKVKSGIVMQEKDNFLDSEIIQEDVDDVVPPEPVTSSSDMVVMQGAWQASKYNDEEPGELEPQVSDGMISMVPEEVDEQAEGLKQVEEMVKTSKKKKTIIQKEESADVERVAEIAKLKKSPKEGTRTIKESIGGTKIKRVRDVKTLDVGDGEIVAEVNKTVVFMPKSGEAEESYLDSDPVEIAKKKLQMGNPVKGKGAVAMAAPEGELDEQPEASKLLTVKKGNTIAMVEEGQMESPQAERVEENITLRTEEEPHDGKCSAKNRFDKPCKNPSMKDSKFCFIHDMQKKNS